MNGLLTPDGYPLLGFTYLPKQRLSAVLQQVFARSRSEPAVLTLLAKQGDVRLRELRRERRLPGLHGTQLQKVAARLLS